MGIYDNTVASRSHLIELQEIGLEGEQDLAVGFGERFSLANKLTYQRFTPLGREAVIESEFRERDKILIDNGLATKELLTTQRIISRAESGNYPSLTSDTQGRNMLGLPKSNVLGFISFKDELERNNENDQILLDLISEHPELGIKSDDEIFSDVLLKQQELLSKDSDFADRSTFMGKLGYLTGSMVGWIREPKHFLSSLIGLSPVGRATMAANFFRVGAAEASIVTALELQDAPTQTRFRREFGEPELTTGQAIVESGINIAGSAVFGGTVGAVTGRFFRPIPPSANNSNNAVSEFTQELLDEFSTIQQSPSSTPIDLELQQAASLLDETLQIARNAPIDTTYETHMSNYSQARVSIAEGDNITVGVDDFSMVQRASDQEVFAPINTETGIPESNIEIQQRAVGKLRTTLEARDVNITQRSPDGDLIEVSSRETLRQLDSEDAAIRATIDCLG